MRQLSAYQSIDAQQKIKMKSIQYFLFGPNQMCSCSAKYFDKIMQVKKCVNLQSPLRKSTRKKVQTLHYGHESPNFTSPQSNIQKESQESDTSE
jgi:hypothetical protein